MKNDYFNKQHTGGSFDALGVRYQNLCALYFALREINNSDFTMLGIETDDDFSLTYKNKAAFFQVKYATLTHLIAKNYVRKNTTLIGDGLNKKLSTLSTYLKQYRNHQSSDSSTSTKESVRKDFYRLLSRHGFRQEDFDIIADSWNVVCLPRSKIEETIKFHIMEWGVEQGLMIKSDDCLADLIHLIDSCRSERDFIKADLIKKTLKKHVIKKLFRQKYTEKIDFISRLNINPSQLIKDINELIETAEIELRSGKFQDSLTNYLKIADVTKSVEIYCKCAALYQQLKDNDNALIWCEKAFDVDSKNHFALAIKGSLMLDRHQDDYALELLLAANFSLHGSAPVLHNIGICYDRKKQPVNAIEFFEEAIAADSDFTLSYISLAILQFHRGAVHSANENIDKALLHEPGMPEALAWKGEIRRNKAILW